MLNVFTDGACNQLGKGGWAWAFYIIQPPDVKTLVSDSGMMVNTTNNQMEMTALIEAMKQVPTDRLVQFHSDSKYVVNGLNDWIYGWKAKGWKTVNGQPVKNKDLWEVLWEHHLKRVNNYRLVWVKGHAGNHLNELVDKMAVKAAYG